MAAMNHIMAAMMNAAGPKESKDEEEDTPRCSVCLGAFNDTDCIPYIACQPGGHPFCKDCIYGMIPKSRNLDVSRIKEEPHGVSFHLFVQAPMADCQIQFKCPICRVETPLYDKKKMTGISFPFHSDFTCQHIPIRYLKEQDAAHSGSIKEREKAKEEIAQEIKDKTTELKEFASRFSTMAAGFSASVSKFEETERNKLAEIEKEYQKEVKKMIELEQKEETLRKTIAALNKTYAAVAKTIADINRKRYAEEKVFNETMAQMDLEHRTKIAELKKEEKEMLETIEKNKATLMGKMYRQAREEVQEEMKDDREKMMNKTLANCREIEEQFRFAMEARKADTELAHKIHRENLEKETERVKRSLAKLNAQFEKKKEDAREEAKGMTKHFYDEEMAKIKREVATARQKIAHELDQYGTNREEFRNFINVKEKFTAWSRKGYKISKSQVLPDEEIMKWTNFIGLLNSGGKESCKISIEEYMEFRLKNKKAKQNGEHWTNYSLDLWLKSKIETITGFTVGGRK